MSVAVMIMRVDDQEPIDPASVDRKWLLARSLQPRHPGLTMRYEHMSVHDLRGLEIDVRDPLQGEAPVMRLIHEVEAQIDFPRAVLVGTLMGRDGSTNRDFDPARHSPAIVEIGTEGCGFTHVLGHASLGQSCRHETDKQS